MILNTANIRTNDCRGKSTREATEKGSMRILRVVVSVRDGLQVGNSTFRMAYVPRGAIEKTNLTSRKRSRRRLGDSLRWQILEPRPITASGRERLAQKLGT